MLIKRVVVQGFKTFANQTGLTVSYVSGPALNTLLKAQYKALGRYAKEFGSASGSWSASRSVRCRRRCC